MTDRDDPDDNAGLVLSPPVLFVLLLFVGISFDWLTGLSFLGQMSVASGKFWAGAALAAGGVALALWAARTLLAAGTNISPRRPAHLIVTGGPYRWTRNPIYVGMLLAFGGVSLMFAVGFGLVMLPLFWLVLNYGVVDPEEIYLASKFPDEFDDYARRTRRWI